MADRALADLLSDNQPDALCRVNRQTVTDPDRCQLGFCNCEVTWHDLARSMRKSEPEVTEALPMRACWRPEHALMRSPRGSETALRQPIAV
jgi:hypothetical protein